ncbi:MAG: heavy-metal-associated domain-containing protein [Ktedonobacteraceae bacterium]
MESTTFVAPDISCEHCQHAIEGALNKVDGVNTVKVDIPAKSVAVSYDAQKLTRAQLVEKLDDIGYAVTA